MEKLILLLSFYSVTFTLHAQVAINNAGTPPHSSAMLDVSSTQHGVLLPRITTAQRNALNAPAVGLIIYNSTTGTFNVYAGSSGWFNIDVMQVSTTTGTSTPGLGVAINLTGAAPAASAMLDVSSTDKGVLLPRTTPTAIIGPAAGLIIYNSSTNRLNYFNGISWLSFCHSFISTTIGPGAPTGGGVAISATGIAPDLSAMLDIIANDRGVLIPTLTNAQRNILNPAIGLMIYNSSANEIQHWNGTGWQSWQTALPATPGAIAGSTTPCQSVTGVTYSISPVPGATSYNWTVPSGASITSGQGTTSIVVNWGTSSGNVSVTASNACGTSPASLLPITLQTVPAQPSVISGITTICQDQLGITYSVTNVPGVTYTWSYSGSGLVILSGQGTNSITVNFFGTGTSGTLTVTPSNLCGNGTPRTLNITNITPQISGFINTININCRVEITPIAGATYYWYESTPCGLFSIVSVIASAAIVGFNPNQSCNICVQVTVSGCVSIRCEPLFGGPIACPF